MIRLRSLALLACTCWAAAPVAAQRLEGPPEAGVWLGRLHGVAAIEAEGELWCGPVFTLPVAEAGAPLERVSLGRFSRGGPRVTWERPPAPLFADLETAATPAIQPEGPVHGAAWVTVHNASPEPVPRLFVVCGGVGPFARKRADTLTGLPPWGSVRVRLPLVPREDHAVPASGKAPLFLSIGGLPGVDPTVQFLDVLLDGKRRGEAPPDEMWRPVIAGMDGGVTVTMEQKLPIGHSYMSIGLERTGQRLTASTYHGRLLRVEVAPNDPVEEFAMKGSDTVWKRADLPARFWIERLDDGWRAGVHPPAEGARHAGIPLEAYLAMGRDPVLVLGTGGDPERVAARQARARFDLTRWAEEYARPLSYFTDVEFAGLLESGDFSEHTIVLYGNRDHNALWNLLVPDGYVLDARADGLRFADERLVAERAEIAVAYAPRRGHPHSVLILAADALPPRPENDPRCPDTFPPLELLRRAPYFVDLRSADFAFHDEHGVFLLDGWLDHRWAYRGHGVLTTQGEGEDARPR